MPKGAVWARLHLERRHLPLAICLVGGVVLLPMIVLTPPSRGPQLTKATAGTPSTSPSEIAAPAGSRPTTSTTTTTASTASANRRGNGQSVTLAFGGDVHFEKGLRSRLDADPDGALAPLRSLLSGADLAMVNLETSITTRGTPAPDKTYAFRAPPTALQALRGAGVDVATMANNHGLDYGPVGLDDSLAAAKAASFPVVGIGADIDEAFRPYTATVKGQRIAFIGATQVIDENLVRAWTATADHGGLASAKDESHLLAAVRAARAASDTVVVYLHWGTEMATCPNDSQPPLAEDVIAAGADVVVGSHAHRLLAGGHQGSAYVDYGLGNFAFYTDSGPGTESGVLTLTVTGRDVDRATFTPARLQGGIARPLTGAAATEALGHWRGLRDCASGLTE